MSSSLPRGLRNNNPLNIVHTGAKWVGMSPTQCDPVFVQFTAMHWGLRAAFLVLRSYRRMGVTSVGDIIRRWCPDNTAPSYINSVCRYKCGSHFQPSTIVDLANKDQACDLVEAMSYVENGRPASREDINYGYSLAIAT